MADPFRLKILKNLTAALEEISEATGYTPGTDLAGRVFRGRDMFGASDPVPMISILEAVEEREQLPEPPDNPHHVGQWPLLIQGWVEDDRENPTDNVYFLLADVKKRLGQEIEKRREVNILGMGPRIDKMAMSAGVVRPASELSSKAFFWLRLDIGVVENLLEPYA